MFKKTADIQTADMLKLPVPEAHYHSVVLKPSETQKEMVASLSERTERVRNKMVDSSVDNKLLITNDGRKLALDQRLMNDMLPDSETSKVGACAENVFDIWQRTADRKSTQMGFCDLSTPHGDGKFNVYDDLRNKLIAKGVPAEEIAYIHTANSEAQKKELFGKVRLVYMAYHHSFQREVRRKDRKLHISPHQRKQRKKPAGFGPVGFLQFFAV